jgi:hypothetical protein
MKIDDLIETALSLEVANVPYCCYADDDDDIYGKPSGHWSGTKEEMENYLRRPLIPIELECLSLSRYFGPHERKDIMKALWPEGNETGRWMSWRDLADELCHFRKMVRDRFV